VRATAARAHQSPEELIADTIAERFGADGTAPTQTPEQEAKKRLFALMRERGHLVDAKSYPSYPGMADLPPRGSPQRAQLEEVIAEALSDALERSGLSILDLIERR
jgi:hypothetical protein